MFGGILLLVVTAGTRQRFAWLGGSTPDLLSPDSMSIESDEAQGDTSSTYALLREEVRRQGGHVRPLLDGLAAASSRPYVIPLLESYLKGFYRKDEMGMLHLAAAHNHAKAIEALAAAGAFLRRRGVPGDGRRCRMHLR